MAKISLQKYCLTSLFYIVTGKWSKQAEAEVVPSSSLVEVKVEVGVAFEVLGCNLDLTLVVVSTFTGGWVVGWMVGRLESNAKLNSRSD